MDALIWGNSTFFNGVIPGGTAVYDAHVRAVYFDHQCFSVSGWLEMTVVIDTAIMVAINASVAGHVVQLYRDIWVLGIYKLSL